MDDTKATKSRLLAGIGIAWGVIALLLTIGCLSDRMYWAAILLIISGLTALPWVANRIQATGLQRGWRAALPYIFGVAGIVALGMSAPEPAAGPEIAATPKSDVVEPAAPRRPPSVTVAAPPASPPKADPKPEFLGRYRAMLGLAKPCDQSIGKVASAASRGNVIDMYSEAKDGQAACEQAWTEIGKLEPDDTMPDEGSKKEEKAITTCRQTYFLRQRAMETAMKVADGDGRASNVVSFKEDLQAAQLGLMMCVAEWMSAGSSIGIKPEDLK